MRIFNAQLNELEIMNIKEIKTVIGFDNENFEDFLEACPIALSDLKDKSRKRDLVEWRSLGFLLYFDETNVGTFDKCAEIFNRDHTTVIHAFKMLQNERYVDTIRPKISEIKRSCLRRKIVETGNTATLEESQPDLYGAMVNLRSESDKLGLKLTINFE
jgi:hypothetical protein